MIESGKYIDGFSSLVLPSRAVLSPLNRIGQFVLPPALSLAQWQKQDAGNASSSSRGGGGATSIFLLLLHLSFSFSLSDSAAADSVWFGERTDGQTGGRGGGRGKKHQREMLLSKDEEGKKLPREVKALGHHAPVLLIMSF